MKRRSAILISAIAILATLALCALAFAADDPDLVRWGESDKIIKLRLSAKPKITTPLTQKNLDQLATAEVNKQKSLEQAQTTTASNSGPVHIQAQTLQNIQRGVEQSTGALLTQLNTITPVQQGISGPSQGTFRAPYDDWNGDWDADAGCMAYGFGNKDNGFVWGNCQAFSESSYRRGSCQSFVCKRFTAGKTGTLKVKIHYKNLDGVLTVSSPVNYQNESNIALYGHICRPPDYWKKTDDVILLLPGALGLVADVSNATAPTGCQRDLNLAELHVNTGDLLEIGAGISVYDRSRWGGVACGQFGATVDSISFEIL